MSKVSINLRWSRFEIHSKGLSFFLCAKDETRSFIRHVKEHVNTAQAAMLKHANAKSVDQKFSKGDFVYLSDDRPSPAKKLKHMFTGPYVIFNVCSLAGSLHKTHTAQFHPHQYVEIGLHPSAYVNKLFHSNN